jgi:hypothetical protein
MAVIGISYNGSQKGFFGMGRELRQGISRKSMSGLSPQGRICVKQNRVGSVGEPAPLWLHT